MRVNTNSVTINNLWPKHMPGGPVLGRPLGLRLGELPLAPQLKSMTFTELEAPQEECMDGAGHDPPHLGP